MQSLDIVKLIEKNSNTRLSKEYEHKLLNKIKDTFTDNQQQLFVSSFYCYLNYHSKNDFVIDFDDVWKWLGYTRKNDGKRVLEKHFVIDLDYKVKKTVTETSVASFKEEKEQAKNGGQNKEKITLTINTFKKFCLKAGTNKSNEIHEYYIKLEELLHETMNEESNELREQLEEKSKYNSELEVENKKLTKHIIRRYENRYKSGNCLYLVSSSEIKDKFKVGITKNINDRLQDFNTGSPYQFKIIELYYTNFNVLLEKMIKEIFSKDRISVNCEWYELRSIEHIKEFITSQIIIYNKYEGNHSNASSLASELEEKIDEIDNRKRCKECKELLHIKQFFVIDKDSKVFMDNCIVCYEKENGECKQCTRCYKIKTKHLFIVDRSKKDGLTYECKDCRYEITKEIKEENCKKNINLGKKKCVTCNEYQEFKLFFKKDKDYSDECKNCYSEKNGDCKQCFTCNEIKHTNEYTVVRINSDGLSCYCKTCAKIKRDKERSEKKNIHLDKNKKKCIKCDQYKEVKLFFKNVDKQSYHDQCRECYIPSSLQCNRCSEIKELKDFSKDFSKSTGYRTICKDCSNCSKKSI